MNRRCFFKASGCLALGAAASSGRSARALGSVSKDGPGGFVREASWYRKLPGQKVECNLCPRRCTVADQETGFCGVRGNQGGTYYTHVFGRPVSIASDPIEKKPLFHFKPATEALSFATAGCNLECQFCQNWEISQFRPEQLPARYGFVSPEAMVALARRQGAGSIAFTYAEPVVFFEYALAVARRSREAGIPSVMISNGYIEPRPMAELAAALGAIKIDFKGYSEGFYRTVCRGELKPVLATMRAVKEKKLWLELVHLTIPTLNDKEAETRELCTWVRDNLGPDVPIHFTRFHPTYKLKNLPPTPPATLERQWEIARKVGLHYPYVGNLPGHEGEHTHCHRCGKVLIRRVGFTVAENRIKDGKCSFCQQSIPGVWA